MGLMYQNTVLYLASAILEENPCEIVSNLLRGYLQEYDEISSVNVTANGSAKILKLRPVNKYLRTDVCNYTKP